VTSVIEDRFSLGTPDDEIGMEEVHHRNHLLVSLRLFLDKDGIGGEHPRSLIEVVTEGYIDTICVLRRYTINIPLPDEITSFIVKKTQSQILCTDVDRKDHSIKD
jgi:hypothetical protein